MSNKAILFLYEGETEGEFYPSLFAKYLPLHEKKILFKKKCLKGNFNINSKVTNAIYNFVQKIQRKEVLSHSGHPIKIVKVFIALDREGNLPVEPPINLLEIKRRVNNRIVKDISLIVATQDLESWLFIDIENIYKYLRVPVSKRSIKKYKNYESLNNKDLTKLFKIYKKNYQKGKRVEDFLKALDLEKIYENCVELKTGISLIEAVYK